MNKADVSRFFKRTKMNLSKHSPELLIGLGIIGMGVSIYNAIKDTKKAMVLVEEKKEEEQVEELTPKEIVKATWKCYIPTALTFAASTACIVGANSVSAKRNAALATAYKLSDTAAKEYRAKVLEEIGEQREKAIRDKIAKDKVEKHPASTSEVIVTGKGTSRCMDGLVTRYFDSDYDSIRRAINELNFKLSRSVCGYVSLNDFYDCLGLAPSPLGEELGWKSDDGPIDFTLSSQVCDDGVPCLVIMYSVAPKYDYWRIA